MAPPRARHRSHSRGRYKQSHRGPVRRSNPSFNSLEVSPKCRVSLEGLNLRSNTEHHSPGESFADVSGTAYDADAVELVHNPSDESFDEDGVEDSDLLAVETGTCLQRPSRKKSFAWSEADSISRRSSPITVGNTPQADWQFEDAESVPNPYSSPGPGTANFPSTMPLPKEQIDSVLPRKSPMGEVRFDFSETASTARRSTPFDLDFPADDIWDLDDSKSATSCVASHAARPSSPSLSGVLRLSPSPDELPRAPTEHPSPSGGSQERERCQQNKAVIPDLEANVLASPTEQSTTTSGRARPRRRQRAKSPVELDEATQQVRPIPPSTAEVHSTGANTPKEIPRNSKASKVVKRKANAVDTRVTGKARRASKSRNTGTTRALVKSKKGKYLKEPEGETVKSSWEPPNRTSTILENKAARNGMGQTMLQTPNGPAANTRARGKKAPNAQVLAGPVYSETVNSDSPTLNLPEVDLPSSQSATSGGYNNSISETGVESTYFAEQDMQDFQTAPNESSPRDHSDKESNCGKQRRAIGISGQSHHTVTPVSLVLQPDNLAGSTETGEQSDKGAKQLQPLGRLPLEALPPGDTLCGQKSAQNPAAQATALQVSKVAEPKGWEGETGHELPIAVNQEIEEPMMSTQDSRITIELSSDSESIDCGASQSFLEDQDYPQHAEVCDDDPRLHMEPEQIPNVAIIEPSGTKDVTSHGQSFTAELSESHNSTAAFAPTPRTRFLQQPPKAPRKAVRQDHVPDTASVRPFLQTAGFNQRQPRREQGSGSQIVRTSNAEISAPFMDSSPSRKRKLAQVSSHAGLDLEHSPSSSVSIHGPVIDTYGVDFTPDETSGPALAPRAKRLKSNRGTRQAANHLAAESHGLMKDVGTRLQKLASNLYKTDQVYGEKMRRCLSIISSRVADERRKLQEVNRRNFKIFSIRIRNVREEVAQYTSERDKATDRLFRVWTDRSKAYDACLSRLQSLRPSLGTGS